MNRIVQIVSLYLLINLKPSNELETNGTILHESLLTPAHKWRDINCTCGVPLQDVGIRRIEGLNFKRGELPWVVGVVAVKKGTANIDGVHLCSGSLISTSYAITAAECVNGLPKSKLRLKLVGGNEGYLIDNYFDPQYQFFNVDRIKIHPSYKNGNDHGIALLKIKPPIDIKLSGAVPICLPSELKHHLESTSSKAKPPTFSDILIKRWLYRRTQGEEFVPSYAQVEVGLLNKKNCSNIYPELLKSKTLCIKGDSSASIFKRYRQDFFCLIEPGLPLMNVLSATKMEKNKPVIKQKFFLTGLSSLFSGCRTHSDFKEHTNSLYNITEYESWIRANSYDGSYCKQ